MITKKNGTVTFTFDHSVEGPVYLVGDFNAWDARATKLTKRNNRWSKQLKLKPGTYQFRYFADGRWFNDTSADSYSPNPFGEENSVLMV